MRRDGAIVKTAGVIVVRQRPGTAKGFVFLSLEDETGMCQAILRPDLFKENRAERFERMSLEDPLPELRKPVSPPYPRNRESTPPSHDFR